MDWLLWYLIIGLIIGAYGKATAPTDSGCLIAELIALLFFIIGWPLVFVWILKGKKRT